LAGKRLYQKNTRLGIASISAASITSTSIFASLATGQSVALRIASGLLAATAATFASLQTFLKLAERADRHKLYGARFDEIRDGADTLRVRLMHAADPKSETLLEEVAAIGASLTKAAAEAPDLPNRDYDKARAGFVARD
jgi:hypothetical protein